VIEAIRRVGPSAVGELLGKSASLQQLRFKIGSGAQKFADFLDREQLNTCPAGFATAVKGRSVPHDQGARVPLSYNNVQTLNEGGKS
jgi:hypothetical protein